MMLKKLKRRRKARKEAKEAPTVTLEDMENMAKQIFDHADRKAGLDKKPGWKPRFV